MLLEEERAAEEGVSVWIETKKKKKKDSKLGEEKRRRNSRPLILVSDDTSTAEFDFCSSLDSKNSIFFFCEARKILNII